MLTITRQQALMRWSTLTPSLREALFSEVNADFVQKLCQSEHLPSEKGNEVAGIAGYVLMGFLHPEDLGEELQKVLALNPQTAATIANGINQRIFTPLKTEIDKVYAPPSSLEPGPKIIQDISSGPRPISSGPKILTQTARGTGAPAPVPQKSAPVAIPNVFSQSVSDAKSEASATAMKPVAGNQTKAAPPAVPAQGWSRSTPEQPVVKLSQTSTPPPQNIVAPKVSVAPKSAPIPINGPVGEFERIAIQSGQKSVSTPAMPAAIPPPVIMHEDASSRPAQQPPNFHLQLPNQSFDPLKIQMPAAPVKPAVLELGKATPPAAPPPAATTRVVHYSEYKSPSPEAPVKPVATPPASGPHEITELTSIPKPVAPTPPKPPAGTAPQPNKVIFKDYGADPQAQK